MPPAISVVIPMFNSSATVRDTLDSLLAQTERSWHAVVVDDGSTDGCAAIVRGYAARDDRIELVTRANGGPGAARNTGLDRAHAEFVAFLDPDDTLYRRAYERLLGAARASAGGAAVGACDYADEHGRALGWSQPPCPGGVFGLDDLLGLWTFAIHAQLIRREHLAGERFDPSMRSNEDTDLFLRLAARGVAWTVVPEVVCTYRLRPIARGTPGFAGRFGDYARAVRRGYAHARSRGWGDRIDVRVERERDCLLQQGVRYAHLTLLDDPTPRKDRAAEVLGSLGFRATVTPGLTARAVREFQFVDRLPAEAMTAELPRYARALGAWWARCVQEGWAEPGLESATREAIACELVRMQDVSAELAATAVPGEPVVVLGLGRNGMRLLRALCALGHDVEARDDGLDALEAAKRTEGLRVRFVERGAPYRRDAFYLMSVLDDGGYMARLPEGLAVRRWSVLCAARAAAHARVLRAHWPDGTGAG